MKNLSLKKFSNITGKISKKSQNLKTEKSSAINYNIYHISLREYIKLYLKALGLSALTAYCFYKSFIVFIFLSICSLYYPFYKKEDLIKERKKKLVSEFRESLSIFISYLNAGYSSENAFIEAIPELIKLYGKDSLMAKELVHIENGLTLRKNLVDMINDFAMRSHIPDIWNFAEIFSIAHRSGGDISHIMSNCAYLIKEKLNLEEEIININTSKQYEQKIMNIMPYALIIYMNITSKDFFSVLYEGITGRIVMSICLTLYILAIRLGRKIMDIEV